MQLETKSRTRTLVMTALMAALMAVVSPFTIPVGPIPITLGTFAVFFTGAMLPPAAAMASLGTYILLGAVGLPVFSGFRAGPQVLAGPTGGYLVGYFLVALAVALVVRRTNRFWVQLAAAMGGMCACYLLGTLWYMVVAGASFWSGLVLCVFPFIIPDVVKAAAALALARALRSRLNRMGGPG